MTHVDWHPYPKEKPHTYEYCFITIETVGREKKRFISIDFLAYFFEFYWARHRNLKVVAWAYIPDPPNNVFHELPEPYRPEMKHE